MSFFLPSRLVDLEYLSDDEVDDQYEKIAEPYLEDIDFAFFAVNFGYTKKDYESLTKREKAFIYKAWENKVVSDSYNTYNACFTAFYNANRKKNKRALKLWKKKRVAKADKETIHKNIIVAKEVDRKEGKTWVDIVYERNGLKKPHRKEAIDG